MTRLIFIMTLIAMMFLGSISVLAQEAPQEETQEVMTDTEWCSLVGDLSDSTYAMRQVGVSLDDALANINTSMTKESQQTTLAITLAVYAEPFFLDPKVVAWHQSLVRDMVELWCYRTL